MADTIEYWDIGEDVPLEATFADDDNTLFDGIVTFEYKNPVTDVVTTFTWTTLVPGTDIVRLSVGLFRAHITPTAKGFWHWKWTCVGTSVTRIVESGKSTAIPVRATQFP